jgi:hypothetical protein
MDMDYQLLLLQIQAGNESELVIWIIWLGNCLDPTVDYRHLNFNSIIENVMNLKWQSHEILTSTFVKL